MNQYTFLSKLSLAAIVSSVILSHSVVANSEISEEDNPSSFDVTVEQQNLTFAALKVIDKSNDFSFVVINNDSGDKRISNYDSHGIALDINPDDATLEGISYSYFNTGDNPADLGDDYYYYRDCKTTTCPSVSLDLKTNTLTFTNTELPVNTMFKRPGITNLATIPATLNGTISW